jgi:hypothetical protein
MGIWSNIQVEVHKLYPSQDIVRMTKWRGKRIYGGDRNACKIVVRNLNSKKHPYVTGAGGKITLNWTRKKY